MNFPLSYHAAIPSVIRFVNNVQSSCGDPGYLRVSCTKFHHVCFLWFPSRVVSKRGGSV